MAFFQKAHMDVLLHGELGHEALGRRPESRPATPLETSEPRVASALEPPLCVDLDHTLLRTDLLFESLIALLKQNPFLGFALPLWLMRGKADLKRQIAARVEIDPATLPYHRPLLDFLRAQRAEGRRLILATASDRKLAQPIADHLGLFEAVVASDGETNRAGSAKLESLRALIGMQAFDYAANARTDLEIWRHARRAILVNPEPAVQPRARRIVTVERVFEDRPPWAHTVLRAMRLHHWVKNTLIFVPLIATHELLDLRLLGQAALGFLSFGLCASSVYLLNDLLDLPADRRHPTKRLRPLASGALSIPHAVSLIPMLLLGAVALALLLPPAFLAVLGMYYATTLAYSFRLKRVPTLDVLVLAGLYTVRVVAGGAAIGVVPSFWLLAFSMFLFLSLAVVKRYAELLPFKDGEDRVVGRDYRPVDLAALNALGAASGLMAVLVLALYVNSEAVTELYRQPELIWLLCPLLLYWMARVWLLTGRGEMHDDPVVFAIRDRASHVLALLSAAILWFAT